MNVFLSELETLFTMPFTHERIGLEIIFFVILVGIFFCISFFGLKYQKIRDIFSVHYPGKITNKTDFIKNCLDAPLFSSNGIAMWRVYLSFPIALFTIVFYKTPVINSLPVLFYGFLFASDMLDGAVARKMNNVTELGKTLDPFADKFLDLPILLIVCWYSGNIAFMGLAVVIVVIDILGQMARRKISDPSANIIGKAKTVIKVISICVISFNRFEIYFDYLGFILLSASLVFTFYSFFLKVKKS